MLTKVEEEIEFEHPLAKGLHSLPLKLLGLFLLDVIALGAFWLIAATQSGDLGTYLTSSITAFKFNVSLFDVIAMAICRLLILVPAYLRLRKSLRVSRLIKLIWVIIPFGCLVFDIVKAVFVFRTAAPSRVESIMNYLIIVGSLVFCLIEFLIGIHASRRESLVRTIDPHQTGILNTTAGYAKLDIEETATMDKDGRPIRKKLKHASFKRVASLATPEIGLISLASLALLIASASSLAMPAYFGKIVATLTVSTSPAEAMKGLRVDIIALLIIFSIGGLFTFIRGWLFELAGQRLVARLRKRLFNAISNQEISFFDQNRTGELTNRLASDTQVVQNAATVNISMALRYTVQALGAFILLFTISWKLTLVMMSVVPLIVIGAVFYGRKLRDMRKDFQDKLAKSNATAEEAIGNMRTVRSFSHEEATQLEYGNEVDQSYLVGRSISMAYGIFGGIVTTIAQFGIVLVLWYGAYLVINSEGLDTGTLISFLLYTLTLAISFGFMSSLFGEFMQAIGAAERIFELIDRQPTIPVRGGETLEKVEGRIVLHDVTFTYPARPETPVLKGVGMELTPGKIVALVGHSGSGKSTIVSLIERFYEVDSGSVTLDGADIRKLDPVWLRRQIGFVSQEPVLFASSIRDNIIFGAPGSFSEEEIIGAAKMANAHEFIIGFEKGYDTLVGERGVRLSGGQKQRIAIARALILNPKVLLLDEATSALDAESEYQVQEAIDRAMVNRTVLVIAHRLSTVKNAAQVLVVDKGLIVERGTHDELLAKGGIYEKLVQRQLAK